MLLDVNMNRGRGESRSRITGKVGGGVRLYRTTHYKNVSSATLTYDGSQLDKGRHKVSVYCVRGVSCAEQPVMRV